LSRRLLCCTGSLDGGGSERQLLQFATHVDPNRYLAQIYLHYRRGIFLEQVPPSIPVHAFWSEVDSNQSFLPGRIHALQVAHLKRVLQHERIDVIYDRTFHMTLVTAAACRATGTARVSVIVSPPSRDFASSCERFRWIKRRRLARAYADTGSIAVAVSDAVADDAASFYGLTRERIVVIPSPIDIDQLQAAATEQEPMPFKAMSPEILKIVIVGRLSAEKGQKSAIDAIAEARRLRPDVRLHLELIGDGPLRSDLERHVSHLDLQAQVNFRGFLKNPYPWIAHADLVCIPSEYEGLPNVALEALALKTPVLATNCSSAMTHLLGLQGERGVVVPVNDVEEIASQFLHGLEQREQWKARMQRGVEWVREHHSLEQGLRQMQAALDESIRLRSMGRP
jgi:glycosyltransferase involved in cell wall biosynthesis